MSLVGEIILKALPSNNDNITQRLIDQILDSGLESKDDLKFVQQEDISDLLLTMWILTACSIEPYLPLEETDASVENKRKLENIYI
ncbi:hypothetical protein QQF64_023682 [Cirrhinus molitorella]|uniref:Uncharacterized protein n=1 Tax=Cirrhinus molitorella TaxID=172907 RepID=A0ABR3NJC7_9TELE